MKYKWKVQPKPTGKYSSLEKREFPDAEYENGAPAASMSSKSRYEPQDIESGNHEPITLKIADHSIKPVWMWKKVKGQFRTVKDAKNAFAFLLKKYPYISPQ